MDKPSTFIVTAVDTRFPPHGCGKNKERCFYCKGILGKEHDADCVVRQRSVVLQVTLAYVVHVPQDWTKDQIEFHRNEGTWCTNNMIRELERAAEADKLKCLCMASEITFLREATADDEAELLVVPLDETRT